MTGQGLGFRVSFMNTANAAAEILETAVRPDELAELVRRVAALSPLARVVVGDTVRTPAGRGCYVTHFEITITGAEHMLAALAERDAAWADHHAAALNDAE